MPASDGLRQFTIDFAGGELDGLAGDQPVQATVDASKAEISDLAVTRLAATGEWRAAFKLKPSTEDQPIDMRLFLTLRDRRISETWNYVWNPELVTQ